MFGELHPIGAGSVIPLAKTKLLVGRKRHCDIVLSEDHISGEHCELFMDDGIWHVRDFGSSNGTKVNGVRVTNEERLEPDAVVSFGHLGVDSTKYPPNALEMRILG